VLKVVDQNPRHIFVAEGRHQLGFRNFETSPGGIAVQFRPSTSHAMRIKSRPWENQEESSPESVGTIRPAVQHENLRKRRNRRRKTEDGEMGKVRTMSGMRLKVSRCRPEPSNWNRRMALLGCFERQFIRFAGENLMAM